MDFNFTSEQWKALSQQERAKLCRRLGEQAEHMGQLAIAQQWRELASEIETLDARGL